MWTAWTGPCFLRIALIILIACRIPGHDRVPYLVLVNHRQPVGRWLVRSLAVVVSGLRRGLIVAETPLEVREDCADCLEAQAPKPREAERAQFPITSLSSPS